MNYINLIVYGLLILSFIPGIKIARKNNFNEDYFSFETTSCLKGILAFCVIFHHVSQKAAFHATGSMSFFEHIGFVFVGIFFFCSGYGLYKSFITKENYLDGFLKKRVLPLVISYYIMIAFYAVYYLITKPGFSVSEWICKLSGLTMINSQAWFVYVIVIMYLAFYFIFKNEKLRENGIALMLLVAIGQGLVYIIGNHFPWYLGESNWYKAPGAFSNVSWWMRPCALLFSGEWWVESTWAFVFGIWYCKNEEKILAYLKKNYLVNFIVFTAVFILATFATLHFIWDVGFWSDMGGDLGTGKKAAGYILLNLYCVYTCFYLALIMLKVRVNNKFYAFFGKMSLEIYLVQEIFLFTFNPLIQKGRNPVFKANNINLLQYLALVAVCVIAASFIYRFLNVIATKKLKSKKN
ncbi:MAG: acyltransferase [Treponema sp.]|nr:acyltransferase [Candidatus Treponema merdequi]